jgi:hypothetical protein
LTRRFASIILALTLLACQTAGPSFVADRLFFGRNVPAGGTVSDVAWEEFLRDVVTPRFPKGLTVWQARGQWLDPRGEIVREPVFIIEVFHERNEKDEAAIAAIAAEYKKRFGQDAVLQVISATEMRFH